MTELDNPHFYYTMLSTLSKLTTEYYNCCITCLTLTNYKSTEAETVPGLLLYTQGLAECLAYNRCLVFVNWKFKENKKRCSNILDSQ